MFSGPDGRVSDGTLGSRVETFSRRPKLRDREPKGIRLEDYEIPSQHAEGLVRLLLRPPFISEHESAANQIRPDCPNAWPIMNDSADGNMIRQIPSNRKVLPHDTPRHDDVSGTLVEHHEVVSNHSCQLRLLADAFRRQGFVVVLNCQELETDLMTSPTEVVVALLRRGHNIWQTATKERCHTCG